MSEPITVVVADDHPLFRVGVVRALQSGDGFDVVGETDNGSTALELLRELRPTVALLDHRMTGADGAAIAAAVVSEDLPTRVLILSAYTDPAIIYRALEQGAAGFLSKEATRSTILSAVQQCAMGIDVLPADLAASVATEIRRHHAAADQPRLTSREQEILIKISDGKSLPTIADELFLATSTVKSHVQRLYVKLEVNDRGAAVAEAMRRRLLE